MVSDDSPTLDYQALQDHTQKVLEAARKELARLDRERQALVDRIQQMEVMLGIRHYPEPKRRGRIRTESLKVDIVDILKTAPERTLNAATILQRLVDERAYPPTRSMRTRVYGTLSNWAREDGSIERVGRGRYSLLGK